MYAVTSSSSSSAAELDSIPFAINAQTYKLTRDLAEHMGKSVSISEDRPVRCAPVPESGNHLAIPASHQWQF